MKEQKQQALVGYGKGPYNFFYTRMKEVVVGFRLVIMGW